MSSAKEAELRKTYVKSKLELYGLGDQVGEPQMVVITNLIEEVSFCGEPNNSRT